MDPAAAKVKRKPKKDTFDDIAEDSNPFRLPNPIGKTASDLVMELKRLHGLLCSIDQSEQGSKERDQLLPLSKGILADGFLRHRDRAVRLLAACLIANVLRIFAPDAPYTSAQLVEIFRLFLQQVRIVGDPADVYYGMGFFLLESLATVRSILLLYELDEQDVACELVLGFLSTSIDVSAGTSDAARTHLVELCVALLTEAPVISQEIVGFLVKAANQRTWPKQTATVDAIIQGAAAELSMPLAIWFGEQIAQEAAEDHQTGEKKKSLESLHRQLLPVAKASICAVGAVISQILEGELRVEDGEQRSLAISTLAGIIVEMDQPSLFHTSLHPSTWKIWLGRASDRSVMVRQVWIDWALRLLQLLPASDGLIEVIQGRLRDPDERIRERLLTGLLECCDQIEADLVEEVGLRCRDVKEEVRMAALAVLARLARDQRVGNIVPNLLLGLLYTDDRSARILYEYYLEHSVFGPGEDEDAQGQASRWCWIYAGLDESGRRALKAWLHSKGIFQRLADAYRQTFLDSTATETTRAKVLTLLADRYREPLLAQRTLANLPKALTGSVWGSRAVELFHEMARPTANLSEAIKSLRQLEALPWESLPNIERFVVIFFARRSTMVSVSGALLEALQQEELVEEILSELPALLVTPTVKLAVEHDLMDNAAAAATSLAGLTALHRKIVAANGTYELKGKQRLIDLVMRGEGGRKVVKMAASILAALSVPELGDMVGELANMTADPQRPVQLRGWQGLAALAPSKAALLVPFLDELVLEFEYLLGETSSTDSANLEETKLVAIRFIKAALPAVRDLCDIAGWRDALMPHLTKHHFVDGKLQSALLKALVLLNPWPSGQALSSLLVGGHFEKARPKFAAFLCKNALQRTISLVYLALPLVWTVRLESHIQAFRFVEKSATDEQNSFIISPNRLSCLEDLVPHFLAFLSSSSKDGPEHLTVDVVESFDVPMGNFIALVGRPDNIGILGDRALLVKRYQLPGFERSRSHLLYLLAERFHARLRQRAAAMKWPVQAFPQAIQIEDVGFLEPIEEAERQQRVSRRG